MSTSRYSSQRHSVFPAIWPNLLNEFLQAWLEILALLCECGPTTHTSYSLGSCLTISITAFEGSGCSLYFGNVSLGMPPAHPPVLSGLTAAITKCACFVLVCLPCLYVLQEQQKLYESETPSMRGEFNLSDVPRSAPKAEVHPVYLCLFMYMHNYSSHQWYLLAIIETGASMRTSAALSAILNCSMP